MKNPPNDPQGDNASPPHPLLEIPLDPHFAPPLADAGTDAVGLEVSEGVVELVMPESYFRRFLAEDAGGGLQPRVIIGSDDLVRVGNTRVAPFSFIAYLRLHYASGAVGHGTGFMIGRRVLATAGHNLNHRDHGPIAHLTVVPGSGGRDAPFGQYAPERVWLPREYVDTRRPEFDYGLIYLREPVGSRTGWFGLADYTNGFPQGLRSWVCGYPSDRDLGLYSDGGLLSAATPIQLHYLFDTVKGMSGAPVFVRNGAVWHAIGIHHEGSPAGNSARRIAGPVFRWLRQEAGA